MIARIRTKITFANVTSLLALFVALGGTAYAAALPRNSVGPLQIRTNGVGASEIAANAVASSELKNGTVNAIDLGKNSVTSAKIANGAIAKEDVAAGAFLGGKVTTVSATAAGDLADGAKASYDAFCPAGSTGVAGGGRGDDLNSEETEVISSRPATATALVDPPADGQGFTGWRITVLNKTGGAAVAIRPTVWVVCAS